MELMGYDEVSLHVFGNEVISERAARTIASLFQTPGGYGSHFAAYASGVPVGEGYTPADVHGAITTEITEITHAINVRGDDTEGEIDSWQADLFLLRSLAHYLETHHGLTAPDQE
ncbi:MAG: hypothetical protein GEV10_09745 [Streptosporangiales bacterium]|nr:hypothetical protein [Streptosporangiales bacterium]